MEARAARRYGGGVEERSSKRPQSSDWKPYERDAEPKQAKAESSSDWKPYERDKAGREEQPEQSAGEQRSEQPGEQKRAEPRAEEHSESQPDEERQRDEEQSDEQPRSKEKHEPSKVDAMGQDKHREVTGQRYGLSRGRQVLYYGVFVAFVIAAYIGLKAATDSLDKAPAKDTDQAPWSKPNAPGEPLGGFEPESKGQKGATDFQ